MATHSEIKDQAIRSRDRDIAYLKQQLAEALQQLQEQRIAIRADVIEQAKAEARKLAFDDAVKIADDMADKYDMATIHVSQRAVAAREVAEALRQELDK